MAYEITDDVILDPLAGQLGHPQSAGLDEALHRFAEILLLVHVGEELPFIAQGLLERVLDELQLLGLVLVQLGFDDLIEIFAGAVVVGYSHIGVIGHDRIVIGHLDGLVDDLRDLGHLGPLDPLGRQIGRDQNAGGLLAAHLAEELHVAVLDPCLLRGGGLSLLRGAALCLDRFGFSWSHFQSLTALPRRSRSPGYRLSCMPCTDGQ
ncbi:MAG: hypothetical protein A4E32_00161 [Methanomassiliicoccales archaeon PtaU1.Bin124]|nr:MAG: hypothetical protein A4E32_00161 [Methanomassiliicoccales archaeon PtaU1.Bin124]